MQITSKSERSATYCRLQRMQILLQQIVLFEDSNWRSDQDPRTWTWTYHLALLQSILWRLIQHPNSIHIVPSLLPEQCSLPLGRLVQQNPCCEVIRSSQRWIPASQTLAAKGKGQGQGFQMFQFSDLELNSSMTCDVLVHRMIQEPRLSPSGHKISVPNTTRGKLCGSKAFGSSKRPFRGPKTITPLKAPMPPVMWTTMDPAKSVNPTPWAQNSPVQDMFRWEASERPLRETRYQR